MGIDQIKGVGPATLKKLDAAGVRTLEDVRTMETQLVAKRTGIQKERLDHWRMEARMMKVLDDVKGIGPATKKRLQQAGIHSLEDLARASASQVAHQSRVAKERAQKWQKDARRLLKDTQGRIVKEHEALQERGARVAKQAGELSSRVTKRGAKVASEAGKRTKEAAKRGREATQPLVDRVRGPGTSQGGPRATEQGHSQAPAPSEEGSSGLPGNNGGNGGGNGGLLSRVKRLFKPGA